MNNLKLNVNYLAVTLSVLLVGCMPIKQYNNLSQPRNTELIAGIGDSVINISKEKNLPNAFGASDIFGRKTPTGMTTVKYLGVHNGKAIFSRSSVDIETGATTMNSTPMIIQNTQTTTHSGVIDGIMYNGTSTTSAPSTIIPPNTPQAQILDQGSMQLEVDLNKKDKILFVDGQTVSIKTADDTKVTYSILETE